MKVGDRVRLLGEPIRYVGGREVKGREGFVEILGTHAWEGFALVRLPGTKLEPLAFVEVKVSDLESLEPQASLFPVEKESAPRAGSDPT